MRGVLIVAMVALAGCDQVFGFEPPEGGVDAGIDAPLAAYAFRKRVTITSPVDTDLTDLPFALQLDDDHELQAILGEDLAIRTEDGRDLDFEIEDLDLDSADGADLRVWIRLDRLGASASTVLYVHYGERIGPPGTNNPFAVWPDAYGAVWHFTADDADDYLVDSTRKANTLRFPTLTQRPDRANGLLSSGAGFDGIDDTLVATNNPSLDPGAGSFSYSVWVRIEASAQMTPYAMPLYKGGASMVTPGYDFELGSGSWYAQISDGADGGQGAQDVDRVSFAERLGAWVHLVAVVDRDRGQFSVYVNGALASSTALEEQSLMSTEDLVISPDRPDDRFQGLVDEVRLFHGVLTPERIRVEYLNLSQPQALVQVAPRESLR